MSIAFLEVSPEEAVKDLVKCIESGWNVVDFLGGLKTVQSGQGVTPQVIDQWEQAVQPWKLGTYETLLKIYTSKRQAMNFIKRQINDGSVEGEHKEFTRIENGILKRIAILDQYLDFIFAYSNPKLNIEGDLYLQYGSNNKQELKND